MKLIQAILLLMIRIYRFVLSPLLSAIFTPLGLGCRFTPTCSQYALEAVQKFGPWRGTWLATRRICRCHPWGGEGHDPVPLHNLNLNPTLNLNRSLEPQEIKIRSKIKIKNSGATVWQQSRPATKEG